jgi:hypothetical protein
MANSALRRRLDQLESQLCGDAVTLEDLVRASMLPELDDETARRIGFWCRLGDVLSRRSGVPPDVRGTR